MAGEGDSEGGHWCRRGGGGLVARVGAARSRELSWEFFRLSVFLSRRLVNFLYFLLSILIMFLLCLDSDVSRHGLVIDTSESREMQVN